MKLGVLLMLRVVLALHATLPLPMDALLLLVTMTDLIPTAMLWMVVKRARPGTREPIARRQCPVHVARTA